MEKSHDKTSSKPTKERFITLVELLQGLMKEKFTGYIKINFSEGGIGRVEKFEEVMRKNRKDRT